MKKHVNLKVLESACRLGLGVLFIYSALAKISDPDEFAYSVSRYRMLPDFMIGLFSLTMPMLELLAGLLMLFTKWLRESALLISGMLTMFIIALIQALARGLEISCGCFGVPDVGGREEIVMALVRDLGLIVPAVWLMFRPNVWFAPLRRISKKGRMICLCGCGMLLAAWFMGDLLTSVVLAFRSSPAKGAEPELHGKGLGLVVSSGPIRPGEWNVDLKGVLAKAEREHYPMILVHAGSGCRYCTRLEECMAGETFRLWREDRAPLMAFVREKSPLYSPETVQASYDFVQGVNKDIEGVPYVCVYWPQDGVTNSVAFCGRREFMGGKKSLLLVVQLMSALDRALGGWRAAGRKTLESMVSATTVQISARAEGGGGTILMTPKSGLLFEGNQVELVACPKVGYAFVDWRYPDGSSAGQEPRLVVWGGMPIGCYTAHFRMLSAEELKAEEKRHETMQQIQERLRRLRGKREPRMMQTAPGEPQGEPVKK